MRFNNFFTDFVLLSSEGSNLTPAHHFPDFRFKTYAPVAFRYFRELFGIRPDDYLVRPAVFTSSVVVVDFVFVRMHLIILSHGERFIKMEFQNQYGCRPKRNTLCFFDSKQGGESTFFLYSDGKRQLTTV